MPALFINYGRTLVHDSDVFRDLQLQNADGTVSESASSLWRTGYYISDKPWLVPDLVVDFTAALVTLPQTFDVAYCPPQTNKYEVYQNRTWWINVVNSLAAGGVFVAIADDHLIDTYLKASNKYTTFFALQKLPYDRLGAPDQTNINEAFNKFKADVYTWSKTRLVPVNDVTPHILQQNDLHRALVFMRTADTTITQ